MFQLTNKPRLTGLLSSWHCRANLAYSVRAIKSAINTPYAVARDSVFDARKRPGGRTLRRSLWLVSPVTGHQLPRTNEHAGRAWREKGSWPIVTAIRVACFLVQDRHDGRMAFPPRPGAPERSRGWGCPQLKVRGDQQ